MEPDAVVPNQEDAERAEESERVESTEGERAAPQPPEDEGEPDSDQPVESGDAQDGPQLSKSEGQQEPPQSSEANEQQEKSFPWKPLVVVGMIVIVAVLVAVFLPKSTPVAPRELGAWPDFPYLATLVDEPDAFMRAVNSDELSDAYQQAKSSESWGETIAVPIYIDELFEGTSSVAGSEEVEFRVSFTDDGKIDNFGLYYAGEGEPTMPMDANDGNYFLHGLVMMDIEGIILGLNPSNEIPEDYVQIIYDDCHRSNEVAESFLASPDSLAKRCGVDQEAIDVKNECHGFADWRTGYLQTCQQYYLQDALSGELPVVVTGTAYQEQFGVRGAEGSFLLTLGNLDQFSFPTTKPMELTVQNTGAFALAYDREAGNSSQGTKSVENMVRSLTNDYSFSLWRFAEGRPEA